MAINLASKEVLTTITKNTNSAYVTIEGANNYGLGMVIDVNTPSATTFITADVEVATDIITKTAHALVQGLKVRLTTTGTLPAGLSLATDYFVIYLSSSTFALASSLVNATAGTKVNITDQGGVGNTHTVTPTALAGATYSIEVSPTVNSLTDEIWFPIGSPVSITTDINVLLTNAQEILIIPAEAVRVAFVITAGSMTVTLYQHPHIN